MRKEAFSTVFTSETLSEAELVALGLRKIGLHPAELALTTPLSPPGSPATFPVEVPAAELEKAREFVARRC